MTITVYTLFASHARRLLALCAAVTGTLMTLPANAIDITTENNPPFNYQDGERVSGMVTEIVLEMGKRAGVPMTIQVLPWPRAYQTALKHRDSCVYSTVRLPERETSFKWIGPLAINKWALFARSDFNKRIATIEDAKTYRIGGVSMDAKLIYLKSLGFTNLDLAGYDDLNLTKLVVGRIDLWISGLYKGKTLGNKNIKPVFIVRDVDYYLACNPAMPAATLNALTQALQTLRAEGYVKAVTDKYAERMQ